MTSPDDPHALTVAIAKGGALLAKRLDAAGGWRDYDRAARYDFRLAPAGDLDALARLLRDLLPLPQCAIVRGALDPANCCDVPRLLYPRPREGQAATLRDAPRAWLALDLDALPVPPGVEARDLAACGEAARAALPPPFRAAACIIGATSGHGFKPTMRLRLWCLVSRPITCGEARGWLRGAPVDRAPLGAASLIYTAAPILPAGMSDPLPDRLARLDGAERVEVPDRLDVAPEVPEARRVPLPAPGFDRRPRDRLAALSRHVAAAREGNRNNALHWAACRAAEMVARGECSQGAAEAALETAGRRAGQAPADVRATIASAMRRGAA
jgi:hypothetical protein